MVGLHDKLCPSELWDAFFGQWKQQPEERCNTTVVLHCGSWLMVDVPPELDCRRLSCVQKWRTKATTPFPESRTMFSR